MGSTIEKTPVPTLASVVPEEKQSRSHPTREDLVSGNSLDRLLADVAGISVPTAGRFAAMSTSGCAGVCRAKTAPQTVMQNETPCLSLRLSDHASGATARTSPGSTPDLTRTLSAIVRYSSSRCPGLVPLLSGGIFHWSS